jgi:hypothetical protein
MKMALTTTRRAPRDNGRRNRYQIQAHLPLPEPASQKPAIGEVLDVLVGDGVRHLGG